MILKKPYAFLIKYFKLMHIIVFIMSGYMLFKLRGIYVFFKDYVRKETYINLDNLASKYISSYMLIVTLIMLVMSVAILYLMREKKKPVLFYRVLVIYEIIMIIILGVYYNFFNSLKLSTYNHLTTSIYRDIVGVVYYFNYLIIAISFTRGFGFDIKKFNFDKDLKELDISEKDSEEFEVAVEFDKEKFISKLRRERRFAKYYFKENAVALIIIAILTFTITGVVLYQKIIKDNIVYSMKDTVVANNLQYKINNTYITNVDKFNKKLNNYFVIIDFTVINKTNEDIKLTFSNNKLNIGDSNIYPIVNYYDSFIDLGIGYNEQVIKTLEEKKYIWVFKLNDKSFLDNNLFLYLYNGNVNSTKISYKKIKLEKTYFAEKEKGTYNLNEEININNQLLGKGNIIFTGYEINNKFLHEYVKCETDNKCTNYKKVISSDISNYNVMKLFYKINDLPKNFLNYSLFLKYTYNDKINIDVLKSLYIDDNTLYLEVPIDNGIKDMSLGINIRGTIYNINLNEVVE